MITWEMVDRVRQAARDPEVYRRKCRELFDTKWGSVSVDTPYFEVVSEKDAELYKKHLAPSTQFEPSDIPGYLLMKVVEAPRYEVL
jgi:hypothetical protein